MKTAFKKRLVSSFKQNDLSSIDWKSMSGVNDDVLRTLSANATYRYGIAADTDVGLPARKHVLIPIMTKGMAPEELARIGLEATVTIGRFTLKVQNAHVPATKAKPTRFYQNMYDVEYPERYIDDDKKIDAESVLSLDWAGEDDDIAMLTLLTIALNYREFAAQYPDIPDSYRALGAHTVAASYRTGLMEIVAGREFVFVGVERNDAGHFRINSLEASYLTRPNKAWSMGDTLSPEDFKFQPQFLELGLGLIVGAGATHYSMNHTTGGRVLTGQNAKALSIVGEYNPDPGLETVSAEDQTSFYYNVLHPVNKRGIACLIFDNAKVYSWFKSPFLPNTPKLVADAFMKYRTRLTPAGCHKVYVSILALRAVIDAGLGVFLPDPHVAETLISAYNDMLVHGARGHIGSIYYTDEPSLANSSAADPFVPLAAYFVTRRMPASSLALSPHFDAANADQADQRWKNIVDQTQGLSLIDAKKEQISQYMSYAGLSAIEHDLSTEDGIIAAVAVNKSLGEQLTKLLTSGERTVVQRVTQPVVTVVGQLPKIEL